MGEARSCPTCGSPLPAGVPEGFCPRCRPPREETTVPGRPGAEGGGNGPAARGGLRTTTQQLLFLLPVSMIGSALCVLVGLGIGVYAALGVPFGSDKFWGWVGSALGCLFGGVANWTGTVKRCREVDGAQDVLLEEMVRIYGDAVRGDNRHDQAQVLLQEPGWTWLDRSNLGCGVFFVVVLGLGILGTSAGIVYKVEGWVSWVSALSGLLVLFGFGGFCVQAFFFAGRVLLRRSGSREGGAGPRITLNPGPLPPGVAPQTLMLGWGAFAGFLTILVGVLRMQAGLATHADCVGAFWGGVTAGLGALLGGGMALLGPRKQRWKWKGWETVMEHPRWNWFDNLTVAWLVLALATLGLVLRISPALPWPAAYGLQHLAAIVALQGGLFFLVRCQMWR